MRKPPFVRTPYNYDVDAASDESALLCEDPSLAQQSMKDECDINNILARWVQTGDLPTHRSQPQYGDYSNMPSDYHEALNQVIDAQNAFMSLDAKVRSKFDNDAGKFVQFATNPENGQALIDMGLASAPKQDLSIAGLERAHDAGAKPAVGKSGEAASAAQRASKSDSEA